MWEVLQDNLYAANLSWMLETHDQYREIEIYDLECNVFFHIDPAYNKERQYFVIPFIADIRNRYLL